jgi:predicted nuclease of predicted toxin-antitoxin system
MTKDSDFVALVEREGPPPQIIWLTCGNTSNVYVRVLLTNTWHRVGALLAAGEPLVELSAHAG